MGSLALGPNSPSLAIHRPESAWTTPLRVGSASLVLTLLVSADFPSVPSRSVLPLSGPALSPFPPEVPPHPRTPKYHSGAKCPAVSPLLSHARLRVGLPSSPCPSGSGQPRTLGLESSWRPKARTHLPQWDPMYSGRARGLGSWTLGWRRRAWGGRQCRAAGRWRQRMRETKAGSPRLRRRGFQRG